MPSTNHEAIIELFRGDSKLLPELLRAAFDLGLPSATGKSVESTFSSVATEHRADLVVDFEGTQVIVEVQLQRDPEKKWSWPNYVTSLMARSRCRVYLLVVTNSEEVARWASEPISLDNPGSTFVPLVLGPGTCPRIRSIDEAEKFPELAVLSAILHAGADANFEDFSAGFLGALSLRGERGTSYGDLVLDAAGELAPRVLEAIMPTSHGWEPKSEFARMHWSKGREEGREEGHQVGLEEGQIAATADAVVKVLEARGLKPSEEERLTILNTADLPTLKHWLGQAITAPSVETLLHTRPTSGE